MHKARKHSRPRLKLKKELILHEETWLQKQIDKSLLNFLSIYWLQKQIDKSLLNFLSIYWLI